MKMQEMLMFVLILAGGAYVFMGASSTDSESDTGCEINSTGKGGTVNYFGPDGCTLEFDVSATTGANDVLEVCSSGENACAEKFNDVGSDGCSDANEMGDGKCLEGDAEPVYNSDTNPDPNGDNYDESTNLSGTEGNGRYEFNEPYEDINKDKKWTQSLYVFNWFEEVMVRGVKKRTNLMGNDKEPWKLSYSSNQTGRVTIGLEVIDNYASSMNGETSSDIHTWSYKFNRKAVGGPDIKLIKDGVKITAN